MASGMRAAHGGGARDVSKLAWRRTQPYAGVRNAIVIRWRSLWGHEPFVGCAETGAADACGRWHWGLRWSSKWGHETCEGCAEMGVGTACGRWH
eukprot:4763083-Pyramimonas_sp.AAC.1